MKLTVDKLCRLLASPENILDEVALYPLVMRWFVRASTCQAIAERVPDSSLAFQWRQPLEAKFSPGHFTIPVVVQRAAELPLASPAWLLPLAWKPGPHSKQIPTSLCDLADRVAAALTDSVRLNEHLHTKEQRTRLVQSWGLHWSHDDWCEVDLSDASLSPESAWAPLAIGLASAVLDQALEPNLFATGYWNAAEKRWKVDPKTLADKLRTAWGAGKRLFAVPRSHAKSVEGFFATENMGDQQAKPIAIELADSSTGDLYEGVLAAVMRAGLEPDRSAPQQHRIDYYLTRGTNSDADDFYRRNLLASIAEQRRAALATMQLGDWRPEHLVSIVSNSDVLIPMAVLTFLPKHVHLIYTKDTQAFKGMSQRYATLEAWFRSSDCPDCVASLSPFEIDDEPHALPKLANYLNQLSRHSGASSVLVDVTPGKRAMQFAMLEGTQAGDRVLCWWHDTHAATRRPIPFSEQMLLWETAHDGALKRISPPATMPENES